MEEGPEIGTPDREVLPVSHDVYDNRSKRGPLLLAPDAASYQCLRKVQQGMLQKKMSKKYVQSRNVYENKQATDKMPGRNSDIYAFDSDIFV